MKAKNKCIYLILFLCFISNCLVSAETKEKKRVFFTSGKSLTGVLKAHTDEVIVITTPEGTTFQYPTSEVRAVVVDSLRRVRLADKSILKAYLLHETDDKFIFIQQSGAIVQYDKESVHMRKGKVETPEGSQPVLLHVSAQASMANQPLPPLLGGGIEANIAIGYRDIHHRQFFVGIGIGYEARFNTKSQQQLLPLFGRVEYYLSPEKQWSPFVGMDAGYAFRLKGITTGGPLAQLSIGMQKQIGVKHQTFFLALFLKAQQCNTHIVETISQDVFYREGNMPLLNVGLRLGFTL